MPQTSESHGGFFGTSPAPSWSNAPRTSPPAEEAGCVATCQASWLISLPTYRGERVLSVLAWETWYFRSKALVSSGNRIARRNRCVVFSLPRSLWGLEGVKFQALASWEKVRLECLRWGVADWVPERCGWRGLLPSFWRGFDSKEGCVGSFLDLSEGEKGLLGWPKTRG